VIYGPTPVLLSSGVIGGLVSSTLLTLFVLSVLFRAFSRNRR